MKGGKTLHELMLKDSPFSEVLEKKEILTLDEAIVFCSALDFVIKEWSEGMAKFKITGHEEVEQSVYGALIGVRMAFAQLENDTEIDYIQSIKAFDDLRRAMVPISKSYSETPVLSCWYSKLPLIAMNAFVHLRRKRREDNKW